MDALNQNLQCFHLKFVARVVDIIRLVTHTEDEREEDEEEDMKRERDERLEIEMKREERRNNFVEKCHGRVGRLSRFASLGGAFGQPRCGSLSVGRVDVVCGWGLWVSPLGISSDGPVGQLVETKVVGAHVRDDGSVVVLSSSMSSLTLDVSKVYVGQSHRPSRLK